MTEPMIGEIRMFAFGQAPSGWLLCDGGQHKIDDYSELFTVINTIYGGDGMEKFGVPDLRGQLPLHKRKAKATSATDRLVGQSGGSEQVALLLAHLPAHSHSYQVSSAVATSTSPADMVLAQPNNSDGIYLTPADLTGSTLSVTSTASIPALSTSAITALHENMMPTLTLSYCIAAKGLFPSRQD
jgi:microcystin-dependent protein